MGLNNFNLITRIPDFKQPLSRVSNTITNRIKLNNIRDISNIGDISGTEPIRLSLNNLNLINRIPDSNLPLSSVSNIIISKNKSINNLRKSKKTAIRETKNEIDKDNLPRKLREIVKKVVKKIKFKD